MLADIEEAPLREIARRLGAEAHVFDQSDPASVERLAQAAGAVDILINDAGILVAKPLLETSLEEVRRLIDIDFVGVVRLMQLIGRGMVERRRGVILSMGSQTAFSGGENTAPSMPPQRLRYRKSRGPRRSSGGRTVSASSAWRPDDR